MVAETGVEKAQLLLLTSLYRQCSSGVVVGRLCCGASWQWHSPGVSQVLVEERAAGHGHHGTKTPCLPWWLPGESGPQRWGELSPSASSI